MSGTTETEKRSHDRLQVVGGGSECVVVQTFAFDGTQRAYELYVAPTGELRVLLAETIEP